MRENRWKNQRGKSSENAHIRPLNSFSMFFSQTFYPTVLLAVLLHLLPFSTLFAAESPRPDALSWAIRYDAQGHIRAEYCARKTWLDQQGNLQKVENFDENGRLLSRDTYGPGNLIRQTTQYLEDRSVSFTVDFIYNEAGQLLRQESKDGSGQLFSYTVVKYEENGKHKQTEEEYNDEGELIRRLTFTYAEDGLTATVINSEGGSQKQFFNANGWLTGLEGKLHLEGDFANFHWKYDDRGRMVSEKHYHPNRKLMLEIDTEYPH
jgi:antitoxin component YwqK of YwqJK toxin-antitoxin module